MPLLGSQVAQRLGVVQALLNEPTLLVLDEERRRELTVWLEFLPTTVNDPEMAELHRGTTRQLVDGLEKGFAAALRHGELTADLDPRAEAAALVAFVDGLTVHQLTTPDVFDEATAERLLRQYFARLFRTERD